MPGERECHGWTVAGTKAWLSFGNNRERRYKDLHAWDEGAEVSAALASCLLPVHAATCIRPPHRELDLERGACFQVQGCSTGLAQQSVCGISVLVGACLRSGRSGDLQPCGAGKAHLLCLAGAARQVPCSLRGMGWWWRAERHLGIRYRCCAASVQPLSVLAKRVTQRRLPFAEELHWSKLETNGEQCDARHFHVAEIVKDTMVVFSGYDGQAWRSDLWTLDLRA